MDIKQAVSQANIITTPNDSSPEVGTDGSYTSQANDLMSAFFEVNPLSVDIKTKEKLNEIYDYALEQIGEHDETKIVMLLKDVRFRLGYTGVGQSHLDKFHTYIRTRRQAERLNARAMAMEK